MGKNYVKDFEAGKFVVGDFSDEENEKPLPGILEYIETKQNRGGKIEIIFGNALYQYLIFEPIRTFDTRQEAESFVLGRMES